MWKIAFWLSGLFQEFLENQGSMDTPGFSLKLILENSGLLVAGSILIKSQNATILETLTVKVFSLHSAWKFKNHNDFHVILLFTGNQVAWGEGYVCIIDIWIISLYKLTKLGGNNRFTTNCTSKNLLRCYVHYQLTENSDQQYFAQIFHTVDITGW